MSDTAYPNILVTNPDGTISAALSGSLQLVAHSASLPTSRLGIPANSDASGTPLVLPQNAVQWKTPAGVTVAQLAGVNIPTDSALVANASSQDGATQAQLVAIAGNADNAELLAQTYQAGQVTQSVKLIDQTGDSSFVQGEGLKISAGLGQTIFQGQTSVLATEGHGLGRTPKSFLAIPALGGNIVFDVQIAAYSADSQWINFQMATFPGIGAVTGTMYFYWLAIG